MKRRLRRKPERRRSGRRFTLLVPPAQLHTILFDPAAGRLDLGGGGEYLLPTSLNNTGLMGGYTWRGLQASTAPLPLVPLPPTGLHAAISNANVTLTWSPPHVPAGRRPITSSEIQRDGVPVGTAGANAVNWSDGIGSEPYDVHTFTVVAINAIGPSAPATTPVQQVANDAPGALPAGAGPAEAVVTDPSFTG